MSPFHNNDIFTYSVWLVYARTAINQLFSIGCIFWVCDDDSNNINLHTKCLKHLLLVFALLEDFWQERF